MLDAANRSAGDALVMTAPAAGQGIPAGSTELIAFTARGTASTPARSTFTDSARPRHSGSPGSLAAAGQDASTRTGAAGSGSRRHHGWPGGGLGGWLGGWLGGSGLHGSWPGRAGAGHGGSGGGQPGRHHGW